MDNRIDLIKAELQHSPATFDIDDAWGATNRLIDELYDESEMLLINAEGTLLAVRALARRIFVENPRGLDATSEQYQSLAQDD